MEILRSFKKRPSTFGSVMNFFILEVQTTPNNQKEWLNMSLEFTTEAKKEIKNVTIGTPNKLIKYIVRRINKNRKKSPIFDEHVIIQHKDIPIIYTIYQKKLTRSSPYAVISKFDQIEFSIEVKNLVKNYKTKQPSSITKEMFKGAIEFYDALNEREYEEILNLIETGKINLKEIPDPDFKDRTVAQWIIIDIVTEGYDLKVLLFLLQKTDVPKYLDYERLNEDLGWVDDCDTSKGVLEEIRKLVKSKGHRSF